MNMINSLVSAALVAGGLMVATPSYAVVTTFASFSPAGLAQNLRWEKVATSGGIIYSTATASATAPGSVQVSFSMLMPSLAPHMTNVDALFSLSGTTATGNPTALFSGFLIQPLSSGSFSFTTTAAITLGATTFAAGSNLLSGVYGGGAIAGANGSTSGQAGGSTGSGDTIAFTSDFLDFSSTVDREWSMNFSSASPALGRSAAGASLSTFRALVGGNFSSSAAPVVTAVIPEPAAWALIIGGFGLMGLQVRRRSHRTVVSA